RRALQHYRRAGWPSGACVATIASSLANGPTPVDEALADCHELMRATDLNGEAATLPFIALLTAMNGDFDSARALLTRAREIRDDLGQTIAFEYGGRAAEWQTELPAGQLDEGPKALRAS